MRIDIKNMNKARVLKALYNRATAQGVGFFAHNPKDMTEDQANDYLKTGQTYFDYVQGRVMKISLEDDAMRTALYDRDNGIGAAEAALVKEFGRAAVNAV